MSRPGLLRAVLLGGAVVLGVLVAFEPAVAVVAVVAVAALAVGGRRPFLLGLLLLAWGAVRFLILDAFGGFSWALNVGEIGIVAYLLVLALFRGRKDHWLRSAWAAVGLAAVFTALAVLSWFLNAGTPLELVSGLRGHLLIPVAGFATALLSRTEQDRQLAVRTAFGLALVQVPFALYQFFSGGLGFKGPDIVTGTLGAGAANNLGLWMLAMMTAAGIEYVRTRRPWLLAAIAAWAFPFVASSARLGIVLAVPAVLVVVLTSVPGSHVVALSRRVVVALVGVTLVVGLVGVYYGYRARAAEEDLSIAGFIQDQAVYRSRGVSRLGYVAYGWAFMLERSAYAPLGTGPASASSGAAANIGGAEYLDFWYGLQVFGRSSALDPSDPLVVPMPTQFAATMVEYGPVGLSVFMAFYAVVGATILKRVRAAGAPGVDWRVFAFWYLLVTAGTLYTNSWEGFSIIAIAFWWWPLMVPPPAEGSGVS